MTPHSVRCVGILPAFCLSDGTEDKFAVFDVHGDDAAAAGASDVAVNLTLRARDLVGEAAATALLDLIRETDGEAADGEE